MTRPVLSEQTRGPEHFEPLLAGDRQRVARVAKAHNPLKKTGGVESVCRE
jgi:hypothetical protein